MCEPKQKNRLYMHARSWMDVSNTHTHTSSRGEEGETVRRAAYRYYRRSAAQHRRSAVQDGCFKRRGSARSCSGDSFDGDDRLRRRLTHCDAYVSQLVRVVLKGHIHACLGCLRRYASHTLPATELGQPPVVHEYVELHQYSP